MIHTQHLQLLRSSEGVRRFLIEQQIPKNSRIAIRNMSSESTIAWIWGIARHQSTAVLISDRAPENIVSERCEQVQATYIFSHQPPPVSPTKCNPVDIDRIAIILFTSGSTQAPKAVAHSLRGLISSAHASNKNIALKKEDRWLLSLALWHIGGLAITFRTLYSGAQTVFPTPNITLATQIQQEKITHLSLVPTQLHRLLQEKGDISSLKGILVGGGPIPPSLIETARKRNLPVYTTYGMTELGSQFCTTPPLANLQMLKTAGKPLQGWTIHIATNGEICAKGTPLFLGYVHGKTLSHPFDNNGFFHTGDRGSIDALGLLHVLGRCDQMFISGGENIHPEEIERCLCDIPHLEAALVIAIENPEYGMRPVSFIKGDINKRDIITHLTKRLPKFKHPDLFFMWPAQLSTKKPSREKAEKLLSQAILIK